MKMPTRIVGLFVMIAVLFCVPGSIAEVVMNLEREEPVVAQRITAMAISDESSMLAVGLEDGMILLCQTSPFKRVKSLMQHNKSITCLEFSEKERMLVAGSEDKTISIWDLNQFTLLKQFKDFKSKVRCLALSPSEKMVAVGGDRKEVYLVNFPDGTLRGIMKGHKADVKLVSFGDEDLELFSVDKKGQLLLWDVSNLRVVRKSEIAARTWDNSGVNLKSVAISADKSAILVGVEETVLAKGGRKMMFRYNLAWYSARDFSEMGLITVENRQIDKVALSPDNQYAAIFNSRLKQGKLELWDLDQGKKAHSLFIEGDVSGFLFSDDGSQLMISTTRNANNLESYISLWNVEGITMRRPPSRNCSLKEDYKHPLIDQSDSKTIAVIDFDAIGVDSGLALSTSSFVQSSLSNVPGLRVLERMRIDEILNELKLQASGLTVAGAAEVGGLLGADFMLLGTLNNVGEDMILVVRVVDVSSAIVVGSRTVRCVEADAVDIVSMVDILMPSLLNGF